MESAGLPEAKLDKVIERYEMLQAQMSAGGHDAGTFVRLSKEYAEIEPLVKAIRSWRKLRGDVADLIAMRDDPSSDSEMRALAETEWKEAQAALPELERQVKLLLLPKDAADEKNAILEVRAGTGGDEAALFARDLFEMYRGYAARHGWKFEVESIADTELERLLAPFNRGPQASASPGAGLGLAIVRSITQRLDISLELGHRSNKPGLVARLGFAA